MSIPAYFLEWILVGLYSEEENKHLDGFPWIHTTLVKSCMNFSSASFVNIDIETFCPAEIRLSYGVS